jgi:glycerol uptake facilitator-like aquaporin
MFSRTKVTAIVAEFLGVATLTSVILAVSKSGVGFSLFIASAVGVSAGVLGLVVAGVSAPQFNPAVTLGLWTARKVPTPQAVMNIAAQFLGGYVALRLYEYLVNQPLTTIAAKSFDWRVLVSEAVGAFVLTFVIAAVVYQNYKGVRLAIAFGGAFFIGMMVASIASNGIVNPAIALGLKSWSRAYVLGPLLGGIVGANVYAYIFAPADARPKYNLPKAVLASSKTTTKAPAKKKPAAKKTSRKK